MYACTLRLFACLQTDSVTVTLFYIQRINELERDNSSYAIGGALIRLRSDVFGRCIRGVGYNDASVRNLTKVRLAV